MAKLYPIKQDITNVNIGGRNTPQWIVIHFVGAAGQAQANANYFRNTYREASAHYFIDPNTIIQVVPDNRQAWHIGDGSRSGQGQYNGYHRYGATNANSIGIEMCQDTSTGANAWEWQIHAKTYEQTLLLTQKLQKQYGIPDSRVIRHFDASGKICPGCWRHNNWAKWTQFKKDLANLNKNQSLPSKPAKEDAPKDQLSQSEKTYLVKVGDTLSKIAKEHKVTIKELVEWNKIENPDLIFPETKLVVSKPSKVQSNGIPRSGTFRFNTTVNVRNSPSPTGAIPAQYKPGEVVNYHGVTTQNGYDWLIYTSYSGRTRYVASGNSSQRWGTFI